MFEILTIVAVDGTRSPVSHRDTCCLLVPICSAKASCVSPLDSLNAGSLSRLNIQFIVGVQSFGHCLIYLFGLVNIFFINY